MVGYRIQLRAAVMDSHARTRLTSNILEISFSVVTVFKCLFPSLVYSFSTVTTAILKLLLKLENFRLNFSRFDSRNWRMRPRDCGDRRWTLIKCFVLN